MIARDLVLLAVPDPSRSWAEGYVTSPDVTYETEVASEGKQAGLEVLTPGGVGRDGDKRQMSRTGGYTP